jgi:two-component sensor histidine kinase
MTTFVQVHDRDTKTPLRELTQRIHNELIFSINIVSSAAVRTENPEVKVALSNVVELLEQQADIHRVLTIPDRDGLVDAAECIRKLGFAMRRSSLEPLGIRLGLVAGALPLEAERSWRLALAVHELVSNAGRHACFDGRDGTIKITLSFADPVVNCIVTDNGTLSERLKPARGLRIVGDLANSLGGRIEYGFGAQFSSFLLAFPLTEREQQANRVVASRRHKVRRHLENACAPSVAVRPPTPPEPLGALLCKQ